MTESERAAANEVIAEATFSYLQSRVPPAAVIALYAPKGSEVQTAEIDRRAREAGWTVAYPRVADEAENANRVLGFFEVAIDELVVGKFGLREPHGESPRIPLASISAFVVPGLAFDKGGGRVGWGHGYYDATLAAAGDALRIGLAFECQIVDEVPREAHDALVHVVVTERATHEVTVTVTG